VQAAHGALFLDEVGDLPFDVQVTLLRFLESGEFLRLGETQVQRADVRMIVATNHELREAVERGTFRRDLFFRMNEVEIRLPPLRERQDDILPLGRHFLGFYGGMEGPRLCPDAEAVLRSYPWPGNVRELENVMRRVAALHTDDRDVATSLLPFLTTDARSRPRLRARNRRRAVADHRGLSNRRQQRALAKLLGVRRGVSEAQAAAAGARLAPPAPANLSPTSGFCLPVTLAELFVSSAWRAPPAFEPAAIPLPRIGARSRRPSAPQHEQLFPIGYQDVQERSTNGTGDAPDIATGMGHRDAIETPKRSRMQ
jgi:hypothetical protein